MSGVTLRRVSVLSVQVGDLIAIKPHCECAKVAKAPASHVNADGIVEVEVAIENAQYPLRCIGSSIMFRLEAD